MSDKDNITLPREVAEHLTKMLEECPLLPNGDWSERDCAALTALRAALAAPRPELGLMELAQQMKPLDADIAAILYANLDSLYIEDEPAAAPRPEPEKERAEVAAPARSGVGQTEEIDSFTPEAYHEKRHPGYVIGNHWLETAYSRICAGESEDAILEDYELVREPRLRDLRRDAERYRWMKREVKRIPPSWGLVGWDAAIDAAMQEDKT